MKIDTRFLKCLTILLTFISIPVAAQTTRQPYLQVPTPSSIVVRWQTGTGIPGKIFYGTSVSSLDQSTTESDYEEIYHEVKLTGLTSDTRYYYSVDGPSMGKDD